MGMALVGANLLLGSQADFSGMIRQPELLAMALTSCLFLPWKRPAGRRLGVTTYSPKSPESDPPPEPNQ